MKVNNHITKHQNFQTIFILSLSFSVVRGWSEFQVIHAMRKPVKGFLQLLAKIILPTDVYKLQFSDFESQFSNDM